MCSSVQRFMVGYMCILTAIAPRAESRIRQQWRLICKTQRKPLPTCLKALVLALDEVGTITNDEVRIVMGIIGVWRRF